MGKRSWQHGFDPRHAANASEKAMAIREDVTGPSLLPAWRRECRWMERVSQDHMGHRRNRQQRCFVRRLRPSCALQSQMNSLPLKQQANSLLIVFDNIPLTGSHQHYDRKEYLHERCCRLTSREPSKPSRNYGHLAKPGSSIFHHTTAWAPPQLARAAAVRASRRR